MVVANDVTRDSRVLREAGALAAAGHRVTVLGMMTARTQAPEIERRDGFVIRRLPYRARPPGWWVPPDFYSRIRYRAERQGRLHRARVRDAWRQVRGDVRRGRARLLHRWPGVGARARWWGRWPREGRTQPAGARRGSAIARRVPLTHLGRLVARARQTPLSRWPSAATRRLRLDSSAAGRRLAVWATNGRRKRRRASTRVPQIHVHLPSLSVGQVGGRMARTMRRMSIGAAGGLRAWASIIGLLVWGSGYLLANRVTSGAIEWMTGWRWRWIGWARFVNAHAPDADVWHGHDMTSLPAIIELRRARGGYAVYDSHEVYFESGRHADQPRWAKAPLERLERRLAAEVDAVITVNQSLSEILGERLGRDRIEVLYNCPARTSIPGPASPLREAIGLAASVPLLLYHGSLAPHRGLEQLLDAMRRPELASAHLAFLGFGPLTDWLRTECDRPTFEGRIHVLDAVDPGDLARWLAGADVAVAPIQPSTLNHRFSSPNKVFEAISVGIPVAGSDFPEFRRVIADPAHGPLGELFDPVDPGAIAAAVRRILDLEPQARAKLRSRCLRASAVRWNWETESKGLVDLYRGFETNARTGAIASVSGAAA